MTDSSKTIAIIAEKPSVARDIARVLGVTEQREGYLEGGKYLVTWAFGHLTSLAAPEDYGFSALPYMPDPFQLCVRKTKGKKGYETDPGAESQLEVIRSVFDRSDCIIVATDAGREGELIFRNIYRYLSCSKPFMRLWISSLTDAAIRAGLAMLRDGHAFDNLFHAAQARSEADWLIGMNASKALSERTGEGNHSLGRVQTPTLALICARYAEHRDFVAKKYWTFALTLEKSGTSFHVYCPEQFFDSQQAEAVKRSVTPPIDVQIVRCERRQVRHEPPLLYDLTALQQDANRRFGLSAEQTLSIAQRLYEDKLVSYPRTSSRYIPTDVFETIPCLIKKLSHISLFESYVKSMNMSILNRRTVDNSKITDHHALITTGNRPSVELAGESLRIYELIAGRMLEAFSPVAISESLVVEAKPCAGKLPHLSSESFVFQARSTRLTDPGWRAVFKLNTDRDEATDSDETENQTLPELSEGEILQATGSSLVEKRTRPKPCYTEATLLGAMESEGLGTPATRAAIIETLIRRDYIARERKSLVPAERGQYVYQAVNGMQIADASLTAAWEKRLAAIEQGAENSETFMNDIRSGTLQIIDEIARMELPAGSSIVCPKCRVGNVLIRDKFACCANPNCNFRVFRKVCNKTLSLKNVKDLLTEARTDMLKGFKNAKGASFDARLKLDSQFNVVFEFRKTKK